MPLTQRVTIGLLLVTGLLGCGSAEPVAEDQRAPVTTGRASLTVVAWSQQLQAPVPAVGSLTALADGTERVIDTTANPSKGQTLSGLPPGRYRIEMKFRRRGTGIEHVSGEGVVYLEPGADERETVVVSDRKDDKLGWGPRETVSAGG